MGLGGKVDKNLVVKVKANEVLVIRETTGYLLDGSGAGFTTIAMSGFAPDPTVSNRALCGVGLSLVEVVMVVRIWLQLSRNDSSNRVLKSMCSSSTSTDRS